MTPPFQKSPMSSRLSQDSLARQWHSLSIEEIEQILGSDLQRGLTHDEAAERRKQFGANQLSHREARSPWVRFLQQFNQPLLYILLLAGALALFLQDWIDAGVIFAVVSINAIIGYIQESKAEKAIAALAASITTETTAIRNGEEQILPSDELVPGDLVQLNSGDKVPADLRLSEVNSLQVDESALTGESVPVDKATQPIDGDTPLADRVNMVYAGTMVTAGQGQGMVVAIGEGTETGRISELVEQSETLTTPLMRKLEKFSWRLLYIILGLAAFTLAVGLGQGQSWVAMFKAAVALAVSGIPEELPPLVTIILAIGVSRMAARHAIIRKLPAVETLGSTTVICSDKTGTLTENEMTVEAIYADGREYTVEGTGYTTDGNILLHHRPVDLAEAPGLDACLRNGLLCNDSRLEAGEPFTVVGDPTEGALIVAARKVGWDCSSLNAEMPRLDSIPFESQHQYMATLHRESERPPSAASPAPSHIIYLKGSVEAVLQRCDRQLDATGEETPLSQEQIHQVADEMANRGLRVLAFAQKRVSSSQVTLQPEDVETGLTFIGLQGMIDPPRPEAIDAVDNCKSAGIQVKMITGDHGSTAAAIARAMHLKAGEQLQVFTGQDLESMGDGDLADAVGAGTVFARVVPKQKLRLVRALQNKGEIVAMTGDGVNDAPALKQADIGIAMGQAGTEVAKEAADMILTDDNFASIEAAVEEGRTVYQNLRKAIAFFLPVNGGESLTILASVWLGTVLPILPVQILWINMVSSSALSVPLSFEPQPEGLMQQPPHNPNHPLLSGSILRRIGIISLLNWAITFGVFEWTLDSTNNESLARTMAVQALVAAEIFYLLSISQFIPSLWLKLRHKSPSIAYAPTIGIACVFWLQVLFSQWPVMNLLFDTVSLTLSQSLICLGAGLPAAILGSILRRFDPL